MTRSRLAEDSQTYQEMFYCSGSISVIKRDTIALLLSEAPGGFFRLLARKLAIIGEIFGMTNSVLWRDMECKFAITRSTFTGGVQGNN